MNAMNLTLPQRPEDSFFEKIAFLHLYTREQCTVLYACINDSDNIIRNCKSPKTEC